MFGTAGQRKTYNSSNVQSFGPADSEAKLLRDSTNKLQTIAPPFTSHTEYIPKSEYLQDYYRRKGM